MFKISKLSYLLIFETFQKARTYLPKNYLFVRSPHTTTTTTTTTTTNFPSNLPQTSSPQKKFFSHFFGKVFHWRDDTHVTSIKIVQFSRAPPPPPCPSTSIFFSPHWPWTANFRWTPSPNDNQSMKRKHNLRMTIVCHQVLPRGRL